MICISNLSKFYGNFQALYGINLEFPQGAVIGLLGPNGAGKTTLMRIISGYMPATSGTCIIDGIDIHENPREAQKAIGYLPEHPPLYPEMTVREYLGFAAGIKGVPKKSIPARIDAAAAQAGIEHRLNQIIGTLSKGYRQRTGIAQALIHEPKLLILDEPTSGLDPNQIIEIRNLITGIAAHRTVILSSHILPEVQNACKTIVIIHNGRVAAEDTHEGLAVKTSGGETIKVRVHENSESAAMLLKEKLSFQSSVAKDGIITLMDKDMSKKRGLIAKTLVHAGYDLLELSSASASLEEIFHKLTLSEKNSPGPDISE